MKRTITTFALTAALFLTVGVSSSFAHSAHSARSARNARNGDDNVNAWFHKDFRQAELLGTKTGTDYTCFTIKVSGMILNAYYSNLGELLAITHNITSTQLPLTLLMQLNRDYANYWISDLFELDSNGQSTYFITVENGDKTITLRSSDNNWNFFSKTTKA
jgi:hypothetical protein